MSGRWFPWHPKGGVYTPPINLEVFFTHILATATRLNTSYGLETLHAQLSRHVGITQKVLRHIRHFWRIYDVINVGFFRHFAVFCYRKCHKVCRNSWFSHRICVLIGSTSHRNWEVEMQSLWRSFAVDWKSKGSPFVVLPLYSQEDPDYKTTTYVFLLWGTSKKIRSKKEVEKQSQMSQS